MPDPHVVRMLTVWQFSDGTFDTNITDLSGSAENRRPTRQVMAGTPDNVRNMTNIFLQLGEHDEPA